MRLASLVLLTVLASCGSQTNWKLQQMQASESKFKSARLCSKTNDYFHGLEFELLQLGGKLRGYINVFSQSIKAEADTAALTLSIGEEKHQGTARVLHGGQRVLLSEATTEFIIATLTEGKEIQVSIDGYEGTLKPENFLPKYKKLTSLR
jgi:hypothetical protein